jgi:hypothetical protein
VALELLSIHRAAQITGDGFSKFADHLEDRIEGQIQARAHADKPQTPLSLEDLHAAIQG